METKDYFQFTLWHGPEITARSKYMFPEHMWVFCPAHGIHGEHPKMVTKPQ